MTSGIPKNAKEWLVYITKRDLFRFFAMENHHNQQPIVIFGGHVRTLSDWTPQDLEVLVDGSDGAKSPMTPKRFVSN